MPKLFKFGSYYIFFWSNENEEPVHVHVSKGKPQANATKVWLTRSGGYLVAHNNSRIPQREMSQILEAISAYFFFICSEWQRVFGCDVTFYC